MPLFPPITPTTWFLAHREMITAQTAGASTRTAQVTYLHDVDVPVSCVVTSFSITHGGVSAGNLDLGIYDSGGNLVVHTGVVAAGSINTTQTITLGTPFALAPGRYYFAFWCDSSSDTYFARTAISPTNGFGNIVNSNGTVAGGLASNFAAMGGVSATGTFVPFIAHLQGTGF